MIPTISTTDAPGSPFSELDEKSEQLKQLLAEMADIAKGKAIDKIDELKLSAGSACDTGLKKASEMTGQLIDTIKENPVKTALIAVGVGVITWLWLSRRSG